MGPGNRVVSLSQPTSTRGADIKPQLLTKLKNRITQTLEILNSKLSTKPIPFLFVAVVDLLLIKDVSQLHGAGLKRARTEQQHSRQHTWTLDTDDQTVDVSSHVR